SAPWSPVASWTSGARHGSSPAWCGRRPLDRASAGGGHSLDHSTISADHPGIGGTAMDEWIEEDIDLLTERTSDKANRVLDQHMIRAPIRYLNPRPPVTLPPTATVAEMIGVMREHRIGCVLVVEGERLAGSITERD